MSPSSRCWRDTVRNALASYLEALTSLRNAKSYHEKRSTPPSSDGVSSKPFPVIEIPLFWGTF